ncbi:mCG1036314, isoform CRA_b [Mus musculus]|nr:mCG1036314, isoform CRA_b [Mus musculus]
MGFPILAPELVPQRTGCLGEDIVMRVQNLELHCSLVPGWLLECRTPLQFFLPGLSTLALWDSPLRILSVHVNLLSLSLGMCTTKRNSPFPSWPPSHSWAVAGTFPSSRWIPIANI